MKWLNKMERRFGRHAIHNLPAVIIGFYAAGYMLTLIAPTILGYLTLEPYYILHGHFGFPEVWRIITWIIVPPSSLGLFTIIMLFFYFSIGRTLEHTWGAFRFNVYIFTGIIFTVLGAFLLYAIFRAQGYPGEYIRFAGLFSTYYINMSIFLAFALTYPDMSVLLYFIVPIKMKWMGILYGVLILMDFMQQGWPARVAIIASLLNFIIFFFLTRDSGRTGHAKIYPGQQFRKAPTGAQDVQYSREKKPENPKNPMHRCTICGRTEFDSDQLVFRYCSKCNGAYEYCQDHLFNHEHKV